MVLQSDQGLALSKHCTELGIPTITLTGRVFRADQPDGGHPTPLLEKPFRFSDLQRVLNAVESSRPAALLREAASNAA
jgi:hypothetical protein